MPEQTLGGIPLGLGRVMKINFLNFHVAHQSPLCVHVDILRLNCMLVGVVEVVWR